MRKKESRRNDESSESSSVPDVLSMMYVSDELRWAIDYDCIDSHSSPSLHRHTLSRRIYFQRYFVMQNKSRFNLLNEARNCNFQVALVDRRRSVAGHCFRSQYTFAFIRMDLPLCNSYSISIIVSRAPCVVWFIFQFLLLRIELNYHYLFALFCDDDSMTQCDPLEEQQSLSIEGMDQRNSY